MEKYFKCALFFIGENESDKGVYYMPNDFHSVKEVHSYLNKQELNCIPQGTKIIESNIYECEFTYNGLITKNMVDYSLKYVSK